MRNNRNKYNHSLNLRGIVRMAVGAVVVTGLACGFVHVRTQHVTRGGEKGAIEREIETLKKEIDMLSAQVAETLEPDAMKARLRIEGSDLTEIGHNYNAVRGDIIERMAMTGGSGYVYP